MLVFDLRCNAHLHRNVADALLGSGIGVENVADRIGDGVARQALEVQLQSIAVRLC